MKSAFFLSVLAALLVLSGCCKKQPATLPGQVPEGFALLYDVTSQEQDVDKLLWIKEPGPKISAWVKDIATFNKEVSVQLEAWKKDGTIENLENLSLPPAEMEARARAAAETTGELLFDTDADLRLVMIYSQLQSLGYCSDLCYAIARLPYGEPLADTLNEWMDGYNKLKSTGMELIKQGEVAPAPATPAPDGSKTPTDKSNTAGGHGPSQN